MVNGVKKTKQDVDSTEKGGGRGTDTLDGVTREGLLGR